MVRATPFTNLDEAAKWPEKDRTNREVLLTKKQGNGELRADVVMLTPTKTILLEWKKKKPNF